MLREFADRIDLRESLAIETESLFNEPTIEKRISNPFEKVKFNPIRDFIESDMNKRVGAKEMPVKKEASEEDVYESNGGTSLALIVDNKIIIASDTRHSAEYNINSRNMSKIFRIGDFFITTSGFYADSFELYTKMMYEIKQYETYKQMSLKSAAHLLLNILYSKRFFPLYSFTTLSGFEDGQAFIYSFDCIGSYESVKCRCDGSSASMIQPLLDSWISGKNFENFHPIDFDASLMLVKKAFDAAAERDVKTKDSLEIYVFDGKNVTHEIVPLRRD